MKKLVLLFAAVLLPLLASAQTKVEIDGIWYNLIVKAKQAEVTFKGSSYNEYGNEYSGSITIPATVSYEGVNYSVTSIGGSAFMYCSSLTSITIPEGVTSIGEHAFDRCSSLTAINIPEGVTSIGGCAFMYCSSLTAITIPEGVTSIGVSAFQGCSSLTAINIPESVTSIGDYAFRDCSSLTAINIPEGVTSIGDDAFYHCSSLTAINIPESVTSIGDYAFAYCSSLTAINIPENSQLTSIGSYAFKDCCSLTAINIPEGVTSIGEYAFALCDRLTAINIPENSQLTSIGSYAFKDCSSLTAINIPEGVTSIYQYAFEGCSSLTAIVLPKNLKYINSKAFANCSELLDVYCYAEKVPSTYTNAFDGSYPKYITLHVPASALNAYKVTAPWSSFGNIVVQEDEEPLEKCATPTISYADGKVMFACDTEGATVKSSIKENVTGDYRDMEVAFIPTYTITAYATKENYEDSDVATLTLCWIPCAEEHESEETGILTIPSKPVLISTQGGIITVSGLAADTEVAAYSTAGTQLAAATATDGTATLATNLEAGNIAIVKMGEHSIKVVIK